MAQKKADNSEYLALKKAISDKRLRKLYLFHGDERYLLEYYLGQIRKNLLAGGLEEFNYKRFDGRSLSLSLLAEAIDSLPVFAEQTLIEVHDFDVFKSSDETKSALLELLSDIPDYACVIFIYDTVALEGDFRLKLNAALKKIMTIVEFQVQDSSELANWIERRFKALGKRIDRQTSEYLAFITGGLMTALIGEIEKIGAYSNDTVITQEAIDAVTTPVLDAVSWKLTDALTRGSFDTSAKVLQELLDMREPPHKLIYAISIKMRQLLAAVVCMESRLGIRELMDICDIRYEFQAKSLFDCARKTQRSWCVSAVRMCAVTAYELNSGGRDGADQLTDLLLRLAVSKKQSIRPQTGALQI